MLLKNAVLATLEPARVEAGDLRVKGDALTEVGPRLAPGPEKTRESGVDRAREGGVQLPALAPRSRLTGRFRSVPNGRSHGFPRGAERPRRGCPEPGELLRKRV